ncbi:carboxylesterase [Paenarthrobacter aurescens]|uniref:Esterase n=1 Tax=Paenarthrobacter aurescens TaxID=43663 RepID=A0A4Y3NN61_PAEAU|nr:alpha/beta fold hydrolase [Paenarthrobacter aurescens]MDO6143209.1 alpha/beta fold hydrolase [Paenarthrobacter aurescens]MDO6147055.1 alpha/beta fold hydrolase [Paenarthrobacter aurescens]MDO6158301.1 alpha/beta fold hydrolase [Paenarthrobacter aurescens]MDO6162285.1 alpha/beta fold hydrolase [Paenarthrobacter aurescens]GEB20199.1 esterase [Paenarthrobacter aurescens]
MKMLPDFSPFHSSWTGAGPRVGVVLSHGFTGSPHSVRPWAQHLAAAGYAVRLPLLPGHGTTWQDMAKRSWREWHRAVDEAYLELASECDYVFSAGLSMGGTLALRIAATRPVAGTVVVNPGLVLDDPRAVIVAALKYVVKTTPSIANDILKPDQDEGAYARTPVAAAHQLKKMYKDTAAILPRISSPVRVYKSTVDNVISTASLEFLKSRVQAPVEVNYLHNSRHVATLDHDAPEIFDGSVEFIQKTVAALAGHGLSPAKDTAHEQA